MPKNPRPLYERFWERVDKYGPVVEGQGTPCWVWTASLTSGYGQIFERVGPYRQRLRRAHIVSWEIANGPVPSGKYVWEWRLLQAVEFS